MRANHPYFPSRLAEHQRLMEALESHSQHTRELRGIAGQVERQTLAWQMVASQRRFDYLDFRIQRQPFAAEVLSPFDERFDPERAAWVHFHQHNNIDEAAWLVFLATQFGKHPVHGWRLIRDVYSGLDTTPWTWARVNTDRPAFENWYRANYMNFRGAFGAHRRYESLIPESRAGALNVIGSYLDWVWPAGGHGQLFASIVRRAGNDPHSIFDAVYQEMRVSRFGRLGKFDYLSLIGQLEILPIEPGKAYLHGATGPYRGAELLYIGHTASGTSRDDLETWLNELDSDLDVGMKVMEDSLCNWQKSPAVFRHFRG